MKKPIMLLFLTFSIGCNSKYLQNEPHLKEKCPSVYHWKKLDKDHTNPKALKMVNVRCMSAQRDCSPFKENRCHVAVEAMRAAKNFDPKKIHGDYPLDSINEFFVLLRTIARLQVVTLEGPQPKNDTAYLFAHLIVLEQLDGMFNRYKAAMNNKAVNMDAVYKKYKASLVKILGLIDKLEAHALLIGGQKYRLPKSTSKATYKNTLTQLEASYFTLYDRAKYEKFEFYR